MFLAAALQLNCNSNAERNYAQVRELLSRAQRYGVAFAASPENTNYLGPHHEKVRLAETMEGPTVERFGALAREFGLHYLMGSFNEKSDDPKRCYNTSVLFGPDGAVLGSYRKMHLFDVNVSKDVSFVESNTVVPGAAPVVVDTELGRIGLSVCYDLRFPEFYRALTDQGAQIIAVPSAFTLPTGKDHWHALMRARAIENQAYVIAPGQHGPHDDDGLRLSYGHSMIVDPWGAITGMSSDGVGLALAEIDLDRVARTRRGMPVADHRRL